jgi:hypothetical protein
MREICASRGNTELRLSGTLLRASIRGRDTGSYTLTSSQAQDIWKRVAAMSIPVLPGPGMTGVGGRSSEVEISHGMSHVTIGWWMHPPEAWTELDTIFDLLAQHLPPEVSSRDDFARGGE